MEIRKRDVDIEKLLVGANFLGSGASKEAYEKDGIVYKVPRGRFMLQNGAFGDKLHYPDTMEEVDDFLEEVNNYEPALVWPLGQFIIELLVWKAIKQLESEGLEINCFAEIKDYYLDKNGVLIIEQELTENYDGYNEQKELLMDKMINEIHFLQPVLEERFNICLRDIRRGNCGISNGCMKLFDFGISTTTMLDSYGSYSDYVEESYFSDYNSYED